MIYLQLPITKKYFFKIFFRNSEAFALEYLNIWYFMHSDIFGNVIYSAIQ